MTGIYQYFYRPLGAERRALNALRPHLLQAYHNAQDFSRLQRSVTSLDLLVDQEGEGRLLLDKEHRVEHCTPRAWELRGRWFAGSRPFELPDVILAWLQTPPSLAAPPTPFIIDGDN